MDPVIFILEQGGIGPRIAQARKLRGLTQEGLALRIPCSKSLVSQVERGAKPVTPWFAAAVARALHTDVASLLGQPYRGRTERADRAHAGIPPIRVALGYWDVPPELDAAPRPLDLIRTDIRAIGELLDQVDFIRLGERLPGLIEELSAAFHANDGRERKDAAELLMNAYIAAKSVAYRLGYVDLVSVAVDRAAQAARETGKPELAAFLAEERCMVFFATGAYRAGLSFVARAHQEHGDALARGGEAGLAIAGSLHLRSAIMAAREVTRRAEAWDYLAQARDAATQAGRDTHHYGLVFGPSNVRIHEVATALELDDADEAVRLSEGFEPPRDLSAERSSHHYIDVARAQLMTGRRARALAALQHADRLAPQHTRNHPMARETVTALVSSHSRVPEALRAMAGRMGVS
jgi:transcriptional regulator with XRE-family HTH domain